MRLCLVAPIALAMTGCGASALQRSATAASVSRTLLEGSAATIDVVCATPRVEAADDPQQRAQACLRAAEGFDVAVAAWTTWTTAMLAVAEDDEAIEATRRLAGPVVRFLVEAGELLRASGVDAPEVPAWLVAFAEGLAPDDEPEESDAVEPLATVPMPPSLPSADAGVIAGVSP